MTPDTVIALIHAFVATCHAKTGRRVVRIRLGRDEWDAFEDWGKQVCTVYDPGSVRGLMLGNDEFMFERVRISRDPNVLHGIGLEGAGE